LFVGVGTGKDGLVFNEKDPPRQSSPPHCNKGAERLTAAGKGKKVYVLTDLHGRGGKGGLSLDLLKRGEDGHRQSTPIHESRATGRKERLISGGEVSQR